MTETFRSRPVDHPKDMPLETRENCWCGKPLSEAVVHAEIVGERFDQPNDGRPRLLKYRFDNHYRCLGCKRLWEIRP